ncbi:MAG: NYN domain-containing protein [Elusimicrobiota bacterium]
MSLFYILDGYNIIKSGLIPGFERKTLEQQRAHLVQLIEKTRPQGSKNNSIMIVFDGSYEMSFLHPQKEVTKTGIAVVYSGGESADEKIEEIVLAYPNPADIVIVSNDKGIRRRVGGRGVKHLDVRQFAGRIAREKESFSASDSGGDMNDITDEMKKEWRIK